MLENIVRINRHQGAGVVGLLVIVVGRSVLAYSHARARCYPCTNVSTMAPLASLDADVGGDVHVLVTILRARGLVGRVGEKNGPAGDVALEVEVEGDVFDLLLGDFAGVQPDDVSRRRSFVHVVIEVVGRSLLAQGIRID